MCGFAGVVVWDEKFRVSRETLEKMSARVAHRGPDGQGLYLSPDAPITRDRPQVGLAFRRLAILDLNPRANQPFTDNDGRWLVFNGEIYNFRELRSELSKLKPEYEWRTTGDAEVLLIAYDVWGNECAEHLNGMFAFAVWDGPNNKLFLARDRMGQKPLYYAVREGCTAVAFASEIPGLFPVPWVEREVSRNELRDYLRYGYTRQGSIYSEVDSLLPGSAKSIQQGISPCWLFDPNATRDGAHSNPVDETRELVRRAVQRQLVADVPLGCFLSGGVDSSVVAAAMKESVDSDQEVLTFAIGFDDPRYDEREHAAAVAKHLNTKHREFVVHPNATEDLPRLAQVLGEPFGDSSILPTHYLSRETRHFVKVALSGDGGDELFGGYDRYRASAMAMKLDRLPVPLRGGRVAGLIPGTHPKSRGARLRRFLGSIDQAPGERYATYVSLFSEEHVCELVRPEVLPTRRERSRDLAEEYNRILRGRPDLHEPSRDLVQAALALDRVTYLPYDLLTKLDRASMLHALEVRSPFMDHELVQFAAGLTTEQLLKGGPKRMLREAFAQELPSWVFKRKKMGFAVPIGEWFRGELRPMLHDHLFAADSFASSHFNMTVVRRLVEEHEQQRVDHSQRLYALLMLELWWHTARA